MCRFTEDSLRVHNPVSYTHLEKEAGSPYEAYEKTQQAEADAEQVQEYEALQQTEEPIEEIPEEQAYADSTPTYLGNTIDLHAELAKSIRDVFSFRGKKQEETADERCV